MMTSPGGLRGLVRTGAALVVARAEFASVELALARAQLIRWLLLALLALLLGLLGLLSATAVFALALWPLLGWGALLIPAVGYLAVAAWVVVKLQREVDAAPPLLHETLQEIGRDRDALVQAVAPRDDSEAPAAERTRGDAQ
jgi:uncharacterized membrane protein YqjE